MNIISKSINIYFNSGINYYLLKGYKDLNILIFNSSLKRDFKCKS